MSVEIPADVQPIIKQAIASDDLGKGRRCFVVGSYVIIFRPIDDGIRVILVAHGHQDLYTLISGISESE